jgi:hypothetical protein
LRPADIDFLPIFLIPRAANLAAFSFAVHPVTATLLHSLGWLLANCEFPAFTALGLA